MKTKVQLQAGELLNRSSKEPVATLVGRGRGMYLWIGNDAEDDKYCFATLSGARLRQLAKDILSRLPNRQRLES